MWTVAFGLLCAILGFVAFRDVERLTVLGLAALAGAAMIRSAHRDGSLALISDRYLRWKHHNEQLDAHRKTQDMVGALTAAKEPTEQDTRVYLAMTLAIAGIRSARLLAPHAGDPKFTMADFQRYVDEWRKRLSEEVFPLLKPDERGRPATP